VLVLVPLDIILDNLMSALFVIVDAPLALEWAWIIVNHAKMATFIMV